VVLENGRKRFAPVVLKEAGVRFALVVLEGVGLNLVWGSKRVKTCLQCNSFDTNFRNALTG